MNISRRNLLLSSLFGAGCVGLRALATGIPASILLSPRRALAGPCAPTATPQFIIFNTSGQGDPINANAPGSYISGVYNCPEATLPTAMATMPRTSRDVLGDLNMTAFLPLASLPRTPESLAPPGISPWRHCNHY